MPNPFQVLGATTNLAVTGSAQSLTLPQISDGGLRQYVLTVIGSQPVFVLTGGTATVNNAMPLLPGSQVSVSVDSAVTSISAIAAATGSTLYATVGYGE